MLFLKKVTRHSQDVRTQGWREDDCTLRKLKVMA